ncbi:hypothetical protein EDB85DRAFT_2148205 [Lactarius pseudohatsudake]|nr:hypothetical protein EDB85DRAFT_2148205 [Lactarius pseudohatsudake]
MLPPQLEWPSLATSRHIRDLTQSNFLANSKSLLDLDHCGFDKVKRRLMGSPSSGRECSFRYRPNYRKALLEQLKASIIISTYLKIRGRKLAFDAEILAVAPRASTRLKAYAALCVLQLLSYTVRAGVSHPAPPYFVSAPLCNNTPPTALPCSAAIQAS